MDIGSEIRRAREARGWSQAKLAAGADMGVSGISQIETGARNPSVVTLSKIAEALSVEVVDLFPKGRRSSLEPTLLNGLEDERPSRFSEAIIAAAASWGKAMANPNMSDSKRLGLIDAALTLSDVIGERVEAEDLEAIPTIERLEIMMTMGKLGEATEQGLRYLKESGEAKDQEEQVAQRREQMRELTRRISA